MVSAWLQWIGRTGRTPPAATRLCRKQKPFCLWIQQHMHLPLAAILIGADLHILWNNRELTE